MSSSMVFAGFAVIPYITLYLQGNAGFKAEQIPYVDLTGGICTLISARFIGHWSDRAGKAYAFRRLALLMPLPLLAMTLSADLPMVGAPHRCALHVSNRHPPGPARCTQENAKLWNHGTQVALVCNIPRPLRCHGGALTVRLPCCSSSARHASVHIAAPTAVRSAAPAFVR